MPLFGPPNIEKLKEKRDLDGLLKALTHKDAATRRKAVEALGDLGDYRSVGALTDALGDEDADVRQAARETLRKFGDEPLEFLLTTLREGDDAQRVRAAWTLGELGDARAVDSLIAAFKDKNADVWKAAAAALFKFGEAAVDPLIAALKGDDRLTRLPSATVLGEIGDSRAVKPLIASLDDMGVTAAEALERIGGPDAQRALAEYRPSEVEREVLEHYARQERGQTQPSGRARQVRAVMVLSRWPVDNTQTLVQQFVDQQRSSGHSIAPDFIASVRAAGDSLDDMAYVIAALRTEFSDLGGHDLVERTVEIAFQASDGNSGKCFVVFDRAL